MAFVIESTTFVAASNLFNDDQLRAFADSDPDFSWGDNDRSLVMSNKVKEHLEEIEATEEDAKYRALFSDMLSILEQLVAQHGGNINIDLEN